jgi:hypothetical protein
MEVWSGAHRLVSRLLAGRDRLCRLARGWSRARYGGDRADDGGSRPAASYVRPAGIYSAAVLHMLPILAHTTRWLDVTMQPSVYLTMQVATSWPVPLILILATWRHQRRLARGESEPSWQI